MTYFFVGWSDWFSELSQSTKETHPVFAKCSAPQAKKGTLWVSRWSNPWKGRASAPLNPPLITMIVGWSELRCLFVFWTVMFHLLFMRSTILSQRKYLSNKFCIQNLNPGADIEFSWGVFKKMSKILSSFYLGSSSWFSELSRNTKEDMF